MKAVLRGKALKRGEKIGPVPGTRYQEIRQRGEREGGRQGRRDSERKKLSIVANNMPIL